MGNRKQGSNLDYNNDFPYDYASNLPSQVPEIISSDRFKFTKIEITPNPVNVKGNVIIKVKLEYIKPGFPYDYPYDYKKEV